MEKKNSIEYIIKEFKLPSYREIPDVGLYLDQVTKYINSYLENFNDMKVTPSMITNYVKLKLIPKASKKTYSRDQIAGFIYIVFAKTVLSMNHIQYLLNTKKINGTMEETYEYFRIDLMEVLKVFQNADMDQKEEKITEEKRMLHTVDVTIAHKMYLECFFSSCEEITR